ncbi:MAG: DUF58 domain-containing protein [Chitinivibrionales bacterium]|nr:DUF58 domain-containing protein [Chitinivibrionales bacterium]
MVPAEIIQKVHRIEIKTKSVVNAILSGEYHSVFKGRGMEFSEVRTYTAGDDVRSIDWNVTARMGEPYIKKHVEERELTVMLVVDASASGDFGSQNQFKSEVAVEMCALLAFSAIKNNDRVGLIIFTDTVEKFIPPKKGKNHVLRVIRELLAFTPRHRLTNVREALAFLNRVQKKRAVVFMISDFFAPPFDQPLRIAARRHDCIAITLSDPREKELPNVGLIELRDAESGQTRLLDSGSSAVRAAYGKQIEKKRMELVRLFRSAGVDEIPVSTATDYVEPLVAFFKKREKKFR